MAEVAQFSNEAIASSKSFLLDLIRDAIKEFLARNTILEKVQSAEVSKEEWRTFAIQRYLAAIPFEDLLRSCIEQAGNGGYVKLAEVIKKNLQDETGVDDQGTAHEELAHSTWRKDFYAKLGIQEEDLNQTKPMEGTRTYREAIEGMIQAGDPLVIAGALLILEATIPLEFRKMKDGRDKIFGDEFIDNVQDDDLVKQVKKKARLYLDDHIYHDASFHFPDLLQALEESVKTDNERVRVQLGARQITMAKKAFYDNPVC